jgi:hypothetical protein
VVERADYEEDKVLTVGQAALEEPHDDHVMGQRHGVGVKPAENRPGGDFTTTALALPCVGIGSD